MSAYDYARVDADGLVVALLDSALMPGIDEQDGVVPAPEGELLPGEVWQWQGVTGWHVLTDPRGTNYINPDTGERLTISHVLQTPPAGYVLNPDGGPGVGELRNTAHAAIERWRDAQEHTGITFEHGGHTWDGGLVTRQRLMPVLSLSSLPAGFFWTDADNNDVAMTLSELKELADAHEIAIVSRGFAIHVRQREMKEEILTMTAEQLAAFVPDWPPEEP